MTGDRGVVEGEEALECHQNVMLALSAQLKSPPPSPSADHGPLLSPKGSGTEGQKLSILLSPPL